MLGMRNATKNASVVGPAPKTSATSMSRTNPRTRESSVATPIDPSAFRTCPSVALAFASVPTGPSCVIARHRFEEIAKTPSIRHDALRCTHASGHVYRDVHDNVHREGGSSGQHEIGAQANASERKTAPEEPRRAIPRAHGGEVRAHGAGGDRLGHGARGHP